MARKIRTTFLYVLFSIFFCAYLSHHYLHRDAVSSPAITTVADSGYDDLLLLSPSPNTVTTPVPLTNTISSVSYNQAIREQLTHQNIPPQVAPRGGVFNVTHPSPTLSILLPDWEVLVIVSPSQALTFSASNNDQYHCLFPNNHVSPAKPAGILPFPDRATFKCLLPTRFRRRLPFPNPVLTKDPTTSSEEAGFTWHEMFRWNYVVYDSLTTDDEVVVFAKGLNNRQGINREPSGFKCVFYRGDDVANGIKTTVTSSMQEVFRCQRPPELKASSSSFASSGDVEGIKVTLETVKDKRIVPTVAYYNPVRKLAAGSRALLCACTMVYNVAKFLKEWVMYHSKIGVEKFILYDNGSDDNLQNVVEELVQHGFDVNTYFWFWPKTQEAGFSHSAVYAKESCAWTAYIDVDEFIYSPSWYNSSAAPSKSMLQSLLQTDDQSQSSKPIGQVHIECHEFGPSNQTEHPVNGVMQGYNCRKRKENRHKSIVFLDAIDASLVNAIHHFDLKPGYVGRKLNFGNVIVNHYKFQAWPEFKAKFRRRVSAYVVDWTQQVNPGSNDRTPGLGFTAVEPQGWPQKFCEVRDDGLKELTQKWFAIDHESPSGYKMAWQR